MVAQGRYLSDDYTKYVEEGDKDAPYKDEEGYCDSKGLINRPEAHNALYSTLDEEGEEDAPFENDDGYCDPNELPIDRREAQGKSQSHDDTKYVEEGDKDAPYMYGEGYCDPNELVIKHWEAHHAPYTTDDEEGEEDAPFEYDFDPKDSVVNWVEAHDELNTMHVEEGEADAPSEYGEGCRSLEEQGDESFDGFETEHRRVRQEKRWEQSPPSIPSGHDLETPVRQPFFVDKDRAVRLVVSMGLPREQCIATEVTEAVIDSLQETVPGQTSYRMTTSHPHGNKIAFTWQVGSAGSMSQEQKAFKWRAHLPKTHDRYIARWKFLTVHLHTAIVVTSWTRGTQGGPASLSSEHVTTMSYVCRKLRTAIETQVNAGGDSNFSIQSDLKPAFETTNYMQSSTGYVHWTLTGPAGTMTESFAIE